MSDTAASWPLPECLPRRRGGIWTVIDSGRPRVDITRHRMEVPVTADAVAACQRAHEMAHARWSWARLPLGRALRGTHHDAFRAVEDARMHVRLARAGVDLSAGVARAEDVGAFRRLVTARPFPIRAATLSLIASHATGTWERFRRIVEAVRQQARATGDDQRVVAATEALAIAHEASARLTARLPPMTLDALRVARWIDATITDKEPLPDPVDCLRQTDGAALVHQHVPWGRLTVEMPALSVRVASSSANRRSTASDSGTVPRRLDRWGVDQAVFGRPSPWTRPGAVLIDASGSMALAAAQLRRLVEAAGHATVAAYSGSGRSGVLRILARGPRRVPDALLCSPGGGQNVVDKPALEWLAGQAGPRIWVSDGWVTGEGDLTGPDNRRECRAVCRAARIRRVQSVAAAVRWLRAQGVRRAS